MQIQVKQSRARKPVRRTVRRKQFPITGAYAFTDYRSQGQTIPYVIVDLQTPRGGRLTLFNLYVALSRSRGQIFKQTHDMDLLREDDRLEHLNRVTKEWWEELGRWRIYEATRHAG
ncbi:hypothetical protein PYCCODRAFT_1376529 [Trametes coccinea BRFM310]|uniref:UvrD-like helicase C-terminal domain-containing protein n=1 Tax=Trametes coccinea (strain BRFM310) TaxID=1353009 RepID=A0A1Y2I993_TRAC3|nr:hypothetical protein PYCCODRAFT_1376529 [Trametes coccinea BRFM310]